MDSCNTSAAASMQSSSGAEEEYNSRAPPSPFSPFIPSHIFDPFCFDPIPVPPTSNLLHPTMCSNSVPSLSHNHAFLPSRPPHDPSFSSTTTHQVLPPQTQSASRGPLLSVSTVSNDHPMQTNATNMVRNPKKRSRASRRAPTTVLTTDTTNFRAMVQEFTGIPAPPFPSSPFPRTRFDLFSVRPNSNPPITSTTIPPYLLRPFAQKLHPFSSALSPSPNNNNNSSSNTTTTAAAANSTSINYQQQLQLDPLNILTFQSHPLPSSPFLLSKTQPSLEIPPSLKMGVLEDLGFRHDHVNHTASLPQNMVSSTAVGMGALSNSAANNDNLNNLSSSTEWAQRTCTITNNDCDHGQDFHGEKGPEFTARSQGMVESWINCSSD